MIKRLTEIVLFNIRDENFGSYELSKAAGLSQRKIRVILKSVTGKTISQFIREVRLQKAFEILSNEDSTASEVAYKTGFSSPTYFNKCFHEFYGYPPGELKKKLVYIKNDLNNNSKLKESSSLSQHQGIRPNRKNKTVIYISLTFFILLLVIVSYFLFLSESHNEEKKKISIAVLPFKNLSSNQADQYFIDGLMEEILTNLSRINNLRVVSRTSVEQFRETILPVSEIGKKLDSEYLVEASCQKFGNKIQLRIQLIEVKNDMHVWAESYEREILETSDIVSIQSEIALTIASELKVTITPEERKLMDKIPTYSLSAYDYYLKGYNECLLNRYERAEVLFKKALDLDSTFSLAYSGLFIVSKFRNYYSSFYSENYQDSLLILANKSLKFDRNYWPGYLGRAEYFSLTGRPEAAIRECNRSIEINPDYWVTYYVLADIYLWNNFYADYRKALNYYRKAADVERGEQLSATLYWMGIVLGNFAGFPDRARKYFDDAFDLQNDSMIYINHLAYFEMVNGNFEKSVELALKSHSMDTNKKESLLILGQSYLFRREYKESLKYFRKYTRILDTLGEFQSGIMNPVAFVYLQCGYKDEAEKWFSEQKRFSEVSLKYGRWYSSWGYADLDLGIMYSLKGEYEKAFKHLKDFSDIKVCPVFLLTDMKNSPIYDSLRNKSEFQKIFSSMEAKYQAEHERMWNSILSE